MRRLVPFLFFVPLGLRAMFGPGEGASGRFGPESASGTPGSLEVSPTTVLPQSRRGILSERPSLEIGALGSGPDEQFTRIVGVHSLAGGLIVVGNFNHPPVLKTFDSLGVHLQTFGGAGEGPGEFGVVGNLWIAEPDTLVVFDPLRMRLSFFSPSGVLFRTTNVRLGAEARSALPSRILVGRFSDGSFLGRPNRYLAHAVGASGRTRMHAVRYDEMGRVIDTLGEYPDTDFFRGADGRPKRPLFGKRSATVVIGSSLVVGTGDEFEVHEYDLSGEPVRVYSRPWVPRRVTPGMVSDFIEWNLARLEPGDARQAAWERYRSAPVAETLPAFDRMGILKDPDGRLWVQSFSLPSDSIVQWSVFSPGGGFLGEVAMPAPFTPFDVGKGSVLGVWRDPLDVESVRRFEVIWLPK